jgi:hypothetical protein
MDWKAELEFELADATEIVRGMQSALIESDTLTPEIAALAGRLSHRADVIRGFIARLELMAQNKR